MAGRVLGCARQKTTGRAMKSHLLGFLNDERGATVVEYGLLASLLSLAIIVAAEGIYATLGQLYGQVTDALDMARGMIRR